MACKEKISRGIILAAGDGGRLGSLTLTCPKVLLPANDMPLINYPISAMVASGITDIAVVVGYLGDKVVEALGDGRRFNTKLHYIYNPDYLGGNALSVYSAKEWLQGEPFVLCMGDHVIDEKLVQLMLDRQVVNETLCVDYEPAHYHQLSEATKVTVGTDGYIREIGKELVYWDALDTGVFLLTENFMTVLDRLVQDIGSDVEISDVINSLITSGHRFDTCDISGSFWADVDTNEDLDAVRV